MLHTTFKIYYQNNILQTFLIVTILVSFITPLRGMETLTKIEIVRKYGLTWYWLSRIVSDTHIVNKIIHYAKQPLSEKHKQDLLREIDENGTTPSIKLKGDIGDTVFATLSSDGTMFASSNNNGGIKLWNIKTHEQIVTLTGTPNTGYHSALFSPNGKMLAAVSNCNQIILWNIKDLRSIQKKSVGYGTNVDFSHNGKMLITKNFSYFKIWNLKKIWNCNQNNLWEYVKPLDLDIDRVGSVIFSPDNKTLGMVTRNGDIKLQNLKTSKCVILSPGNCTISIAFNAHGNILASRSTERECKLWDTKNYECIGTIDRPVDHITFSPDNKIAAFIMRDTVFLWDIEHQKAYQAWRFCWNITEIRFGPNENMLLIKKQNAIRKDPVQLWDLTNLNNLYTKLKTNNFTLEETALLIKLSEQRQFQMNLQYEESCNYNNHPLSPKAVIQKTKSFIRNKNNKPLTQSQNDKLLALTTINNHKKSAVQTNSRNKNCLCCTIL